MSLFSKKAALSILPWFALIFLCFIVFNKTKELFISENQPSYNEVYAEKGITKIDSQKSTDGKEPGLKNTSNIPPKVKNDAQWCDPLQYTDLSNHQTISDFNSWLNQFTEFHDFDERNDLRDPRIIKELIERGEFLARKRSETLVKIIRGDPRKALELAVDEKTIELLPTEITQHLEKWVSDYADVKTMYICNDPKMPKGQIKHFVSLPNQDQVEVNFYGNRKFLKTTKGLSVWGIKLGKNAAFADTALKVVPVTKKGVKQFEVKLGDIEITVPSQEGVLALERRVRAAEKKGTYYGQVSYPLMASSNGTVDLIDQRYRFVNALTSWTNAHNLALDLNASLVNVDSEFEHNITFNLLRDAEAIGLVPATDGNTTLQYSWIGLTDDSEINGSKYVRDDNLTVPVELNATKGNWKWVDGRDAGDSTYTNWLGANEPNSTFPGQNYGAIDFNYTDAKNSKWIDLNNSYRLPFILERPTQPAVNPLPIANGIRKVLVIPGRFIDEGINFDGSSGNPTDEFGNPISNNPGNDNFEPDTRENMINAMEGVKEFYMKNSDGTFQLDYVIAPTITMPITKWTKVERPTPLPVGHPDAIPNLYDSTGRFFEQRRLQYVPDPELADFADALLMGAASLPSRNYDFEGPAFEGILSVDVKLDDNNKSAGPFSEPPLVSFVGGNINIADNLPDQDFVSAQADAILDESGYVTAIRMQEVGAFYHSTPTIRLNGVDYNSTYFNIKRDRTVVSYVLTTSYEFGAPGVGWVGMPGSYVMAPLSAGVTAHELGHNFGLWHANRHEGEGILPNSDDRSVVDYGNPYAVMGSATGGNGGIGDFTISSKVYLNETGNFGYVGENIKDASHFAFRKVDVADLSDAAEVNASLLKEENSINPNTFRIYRHDYGSAPYALQETKFYLDIQTGALSHKIISLLQNNNLALSISGPGDGAEGYMSTGPAGSQLPYRMVITNGGKGYSEEPIFNVLNDLNESLLTINPSWIKRKAGYDNYEIAQVRNLSSAGRRGLRGIEVPASQYSPNGFDAGSAMGSYWISYRHGISQFGLSVINGTSRSPSTSENVFIDMTPNTQGLVNQSVNPGADFDDAFLMIGKTFSDYESDTHITPIRKGGIFPMEYIETVVNVGTVSSGQAKMPKFSLDVSNTAPFINEKVNFVALPLEGNVSNYAFSWYVNEVGFSEQVYLNNNAISLNFPTPGYQVIKIVVSDFKGGISSRNITLNVGGAEKFNNSLVSGSVKSVNGAIQGAKVVINKAEIIEHVVQTTGKIEDSRFSSTNGNPVKYVVDGALDNQIIMHRGEIHRFKFESSTEGYPMSFFDKPDHDSAKVKLNALFTPIVEVPGDGYIKNPIVELNETSRFDSNFSQTITSLDLFRDNQVNGTNYHPNGTLITKPSAKVLLTETNVTRVIVRPVNIDPITGVPLNFGGRGMDRDFPPGVQILRSSYWEDYNETNAPNATATAYVDGVGTIHQDENGSGYPMVPDIVVFGAGQEANYTASVRPTDNKKDPNWKVNSVLDQVLLKDQGFGFDPNSTLAVALYPNAPFAYWSFDEDESLYKDGPLFSTSGFNKPIENGLIGYWKMDEENATTFSGNPFIVEDNSTQGNHLNVTNVGTTSIRRSFWGTRNRALCFEANDIVDASSVSLNGNFTFSLWLQPNDSTYDATIVARGLRLNVENTNPIWDYDSVNTISGNLAQNVWTHVGVKFSANVMHFYINGEVDNTVGETFNPTDADLIFFPFTNILIDELTLYNRALSDTEIGYLAGNSYLDLSGNKYNAVAFGTGFEMNSANADNGVLPNSFSNDLGNALSFNGTNNYLDLSGYASDFSSLDGGTISFWINPNGGSGPIFSASKKDENQSFCRLSLKPNRQLEYQVYEDETLAVDISSKGGSSALKSSTWSHVVMLIGDDGISFYVNGSSVPSIIPPQGANSRAFTTDVDGINYVAIGRHESNVSTEYFSGMLDEFQIFERELDTSEIQYLYNMGKKDFVLRARLSPKVDAVGSVIMTEFGRGYKETPDINFTVSHYTNNPATYPEFSAPAGEAELNATSVDKILLTKDFDSAVNLILPDGREVLRMSTEYVMRAAVNNQAVTPEGLYGYSSPPKITIEGSPNYPEDDNATGYPLFFLNKNDSAEILHSGSGYDLTNGLGFGSDAVRIFGSGYRPPKFEAKINQGRIDRIVLKEQGEGYYDSQPSASDIIFLGDGNGEVDPQYISTNDRDIFIDAVDDFRINTDKEEKKNNNYDVITGVQLNPDSVKRGSKWTVPPTIFADWGDEAWEGHVEADQLEFNSTISNIVVEEDGFGYLMPVEISVSDGKPSLSDSYNTAFEYNGTNLDYSFLHLGYNYSAPDIEIASIDENGSITALTIRDGGSGFDRNATIINPDQDFYGYTRINITGGGGQGAEIYGLVSKDGNITGYQIVNGGAGYFNLDQNNTPKYNLVTSDGRALSPDEREAELHVSLGGSLLPPNIGNVAGGYQFLDDFDGFPFVGSSTTITNFHFAAPWVMILDKGRREADIDEADRAHATAKVVDGNITEIIVTKSGAGYIDPHVVICGTAPKYDNLHDGKKDNAWQWRCNNLRQTTDGRFLRCGHVDISSSPYPPEVCPGEEVNTFRTETVWDEFFEDWNDNHNKDANHEHCPAGSNHRQNIFLSPICSGKKANFVLINDHYRAGSALGHITKYSYEDWLPFETNCSVTSKDGKIKEIFIDHFGGKYLAPQIVIEGKGGNVDPIPVFNDEGIMTEIFYNDDRIKNTELDLVDNPRGAGQGYLQKPWGKDHKYQPSYGMNEAIRCHVYADILCWDGFPGPEFEVYDSRLTFASRVEVKDPYGDRLSNVQIIDPGLYAAGDFNITIDYNQSFIPDMDKDGEHDFIQAVASVETTNVLTRFTLDHNGTYEEINLLLESNIRTDVTRSTFLAEPEVTIFNELGGQTLSNFNADTRLSNLILGGYIDYNTDPRFSYLDIVVDENLPNKFFFGYDEPRSLVDRTAMGGEVLVYDGVPGLNWGTENNWDDFTFTDENGTYAIANLEPGFYNIAVLMEDENLQDLALRPDSDPTLYSRTLYVPGFNPVILETDNAGKGRSRLVWSGGAMEEAKIPSWRPLKELGGLGGGFDMNNPVNLVIEPHPSNTSFGTPHIDYTIEIDGSLSLFVIDDVNSSIFDPNDRYTVSYSSAITGIDFSDKFEKTFLENSFFGGSKGAIDSKSEANKTLTLFLTPNSGASENAIEVEIASNQASNAFTTFSLTAYDSNGSPVDCSSANWTLEFDFNQTDGNNSDISDVTDGNYSKIAVLNSPKYYKLGDGGFGWGYYYPLFANSFYESNDSGVYNPLNFTTLSNFAHSHSFGSHLFHMSNNEANNHSEDDKPTGLGLIEMPADGNKTNQVNLSLFSTLQNKSMRLTATIQGQSISTNIVASPRSSLTDFEQWVDQYFSTILTSAISSADEDNDTLSLADEWTYRTNPLNADTDGDGLEDADEINNSNYPTNPRNSDTDGDGFSDSTELLTELLIAGFHPLIYNSSPPLPTIYPFNLGGPDIVTVQGGSIIMGAEANETDPRTGDIIRLPYTIEGNFSQVLVLQTNSDGNVTGGQVNHDAPPGIYHIIYKTVDSLKREVELVQKLVVEELDVTKPTITLSSGGTPLSDIDGDGNLTMYVLVGETLNQPTVFAFDTKDGSLTGDVNVTGFESVDYNNTGTYNIQYTVSDSALNKSVLNLSVKVEEPAFVLNGKAIDGYLSGSTVIFDSITDGNFDGQHDLNRSIVTDGSGSFSVKLSTSELQVFGGANNILDPGEARIIVTGGYDPTIESNFTGRYQADVGSSIVSPLTTLVSSLMDLDSTLSKDDANSKVKTAFGLDVDPSNFDPLAKSLEGNESSTQVLLATARLANVIKQVDALSVKLSIGTTESGQVGTLFVKQLAQSLINTNSNPLDSTSTLINALNASLTQVQPSADTSQVSNAVDLFQASDNALSLLVSSFTGQPDKLAISLAKHQQAIEGAIIDEYTDPAGPSIAQLITDVTDEKISELSGLVVDINVFPPVAKDFNLTVRSNKWVSGGVVSSIQATDGDVNGSDSLLYSITSSNIDLDADGDSPFSLSSTGELTIQDIDDLIHKAGQTVRLNILISDGKGMSASVVGKIAIDNKFSLQATPLEGNPSWTDSWLGKTFSSGSSWIFHPFHGWLNVSPDSSEGYWFWDSGMKIWWWTKSDIYPYFYRANDGWNYWKFNGNSRMYYNYQTLSWIPLSP